MDPQRALSAKAHLELLQARLKTLRAELSIALKNQHETVKELENYQSKWELMKADFCQRKDDLELEFQIETQEYKRQIKLAEEMLERKKEERKSMLSYLHESKICEKSPEDLKDFDWTSLKKMELGFKRSDQLSEQKKKATVLEELNQSGRISLNSMIEVLHSTRMVKENLANKLSESKEFIQLWKEMLESQEKKKSRMKSENERLNLLIKQCTSTSEPMSDYVTKNVRAKCQSFLDSSSPEELLSGLMKYRERQNRMIKLLKHKDNKLASDLSLLQITTDQTADQMQYYLNIVQSNREVIMNYSPPLAS